MLELLCKPFEIIKSYSGNCTFLLLFVASLFVICIFEKDKVKKSIVAYSSIALLLLFLLPAMPFVFINKLHEGDTYYRFLWLLPMGIVSSYAIFIVISKMKALAFKLISFIIVLVCIIIGGVYMYESPTFYKAENLYELPQCVIDMCDEMTIYEDREYEAVFPDEILQYPRLYSPYISMPYGFETLQFGTGHNSAIHDEMVKDDIDVEKLTDLCEQANIHYIVLNQNRRLDANMDDYHYVYIGSYGDYNLYKSTEMFFGEWKDFEEWKNSKNE